MPGDCSTIASGIATISAFPGASRRLHGERSDTGSDRERSYLDLLDLALLVVRQRPRTLVLAAACGIAPFAALNYWILSNPEAPPAIWPVLLYPGSPMGHGPADSGARRTDVRSAASGRHDPRRTIRAIALARSRPRFAAGRPYHDGALDAPDSRQLLVRERGDSAREGPGTAYPAALLAAFRGRTGEFFVQWLGQLAFGLVFAFCFWTGTGAGISALIKSELTWYRPFLTDLGGLRFQLGVWIAIAFFGVARFLNYIDQRIRSEGWELRLRLQAVGKDIEEGRS